MNLYTVGHGTRTTAELVAVLTAGGVERVADVRRFPGSRRHPHLGREPLGTALHAAGIAYEWWGEELGGRRSRRPDSPHTAWRNAAFAAYADHMDTPEFRAAFERLLTSSAQQATAVMCSETVWWRCHRRLLADAATLKGVAVIHLLGPEQRATHPLHDDVRAADDGWPVYDGGQPRLDA